MPIRLLFVHNRPTSFVQIDHQLLEERHQVTEWYQRGRFVNLAKLARAVAAHDFVLGWFASLHTFWPILLAQSLGRPAILIVGGYDTANLPALCYGNQRGGLRRYISASTMRRTTRLVTNSCFARDETVHNVGIRQERITVLYHGLHPTAVPLKSAEPLVITVGDVAQDTIKRKGLETFVRAAALVPDVPFVLIGEWRDHAINSLRRIASGNVLFTGRLSPGELEAYMTRARVYVQASQHEAFGLALAEAMSHGCIPVVTRMGALPEVVGEAGFYTPDGEPSSIAASIRQALRLDDTWGMRARERIAQNFTLERRRRGLEQVLESVMYDGH